VQNKKHIMPQTRPKVKEIIMAGDSLETRKVSHLSFKYKRNTWWRENEPGNIVIELNWGFGGRGRPGVERLAILGIYSITKIIYF